MEPISYFLELDFGMPKGNNHRFSGGGSSVPSFLRKIVNFVEPGVYCGTRYGRVAGVVSVREKGKKNGEACGQPRLGGPRVNG